MILRSFTSLILILSFLLVLFNNTYFIHFHVLPDGRVIEHAHPFNSEEGNSLPFHEHNSKEFSFWDKITHLFSNLVFPSLILIFCIGKPFYLNQTLYQKNLPLYFYSNDPTRAPPSFSI